MGVRPTSRAPPKRTSSPEAGSSPAMFGPLKRLQWKQAIARLSSVVASGREPVMGIRNPAVLATKVGCRHAGSCRVAPLPPSSDFLPGRARPTRSYVLCRLRQSQSRANASISGLQEASKNGRVGIGGDDLGTHRWLSPYIMPDLRLNRKTAQIPTRNLAPTVYRH